jgi:hypothetical protein
VRSSRCKGFAGGGGSGAPAVGGGGAASVTDGQWTGLVGRTWRGGVCGVSGGTGGRTAREGEV